MEDDILDIVEITRKRAFIIENFANLEDKDSINKTRVERDLKVYEVARKRAKISNREDDFNKVLEETDREASEHEALIYMVMLTADPCLVATKKAVVKEEEIELICGVCQEEFEVGEEASVPACMHKFHSVCLWKWLSDHKTCPVCRFNIY